MPLARSLVRPLARPLVGGPPWIYWVNLAQGQFQTFADYLSQPDPITVQAPTGHLRQAGGNNLPSFGYDGGALLGQRWWPEIDQLVAGPEDLTGAGFTAIRATVSADANTAPDGAMTADKLVEDGTAGQTHGARTGSLQHNNSVTVAYSLYAKAAERAWLWMGGNSGVGLSDTAYFDLADGAVGTVGAAWTAAIEHVGDGWYRCSVVGSPTATDTQPVYFGIATGDGSRSYDGDGASGLYVWGVNFSEADYVGPYVPSQTTRTAPSCPVPFSAIPGGFPDPGAVYVEYYLSVVPTDDVDAMRIDDGSDNEIVEFRFRNDEWVFFARASGESTGFITVADSVSVGRQAAVFAWNDGSFRVIHSADPGNVVTASNAMPSITRLLPMHAGLPGWLRQVGVLAGEPSDAFMSALVRMAA